MSAEQGDEWTPYHEFRKRTDPPPWGQGLDAEEPPMAEQGDVEAIREALDELCLFCSESPAHDRIQVALDRLAAALAEKEQAWEDMRAYNIRLEERAREAERALAEIEDMTRDHVGLGRITAIARAALRPEDTSDES